MWFIWFSVELSGDTQATLCILLWGKMLPPMTRPFKAQKSVKLLRSDLHQSRPVTSAFMICACWSLYCRFSSFKLTWRHNPLYVSYDFDSKNTRINFVLVMYKLENELNIFYCLDYFSNWSHLLSQLLERSSVLTPLQTMIKKNYIEYQREFETNFFF